MLRTLLFYLSLHTRANNGGKVVFELGLWFTSAKCLRERALHVSRPQSILRVCKRVQGPFSAGTPTEFSSATIDHFHVGKLNLWTT
ncbi:hypothetical protein BC830DRAFT_583781 [Chytriomyces sp. MP71]|nr:hypothetical protein BC830DRAFT_583781 [Chytriomyces sp. MP71]